MKKQTFQPKNLDKRKKLPIFAADNEKYEHGVPTLREMSEFFVFSAFLSFLCATVGYDKVIKVLGGKQDDKGE